MEQDLQNKLYEIETKIQEIKDLIRDGFIDEKLARARREREKWLGDQTPAFILERKKYPVSTTMHTQSSLALGDALKAKIKLCQYPKDLEGTLMMLSEERLALLERIHHLNSHSLDE